MHSSGRKGQEGDDRVCEGGAGMCGTLFWGRGSAKDLGVRISREASKVGIPVPVSSGRRQVRPSPDNRREPHVIPHQERFQPQNLPVGQGRDPGDSWGTRITSPLTQAAEEQSTRHSVGPEP